MDRIRILPPDVAGKIAAGEVVERPASVVKELLENAIDAGARRVEIETEDGGRGLISVSDDGEGMPEGDLASLFRQHATSKLAKIEDLVSVETLGFRGEALYSVGAVAEVVVVSRPRGAPEARTVRCRGGVTEPVAPASGPEGTRVEVRRIFFNVPARRKFLRSAAVEFEQIREVAIRFALGHPGLGLRLLRDGEADLVLSPQETLPQRLAALLPAAGDPWVPLRYESSRGTLSGALGPPSASRTTARGIFLFVNGRFVRDRLLLRALHEGYRDFLVSGRHPTAVLVLAVPPDSIDVNVHPAKAEIRFSRPGEVFDWVAASVRESLSRNIRDPGILPPRADGPGPSGSTLIEKTLSSFFAPDAPSHGPSAAGDDRTFPQVTTGRRVFQLHRKYLIEEVEDGIQIVDQHALHERVMLEELLAGFGAADLPRQRLLVPPSLDVTEEEIARLEEYRHALESTGFSFELFGPRTVRVLAVPALLSRDRPEALLRDFLDLLAEGARNARHRVGIEEILERLACHSAVRFGDSLSAEQIEALLRRRTILDNPHVCAHGRPVSIRLTLDELERFFRRR
jgi:DNA mismatch repair protein MutL